MPGAIALGADVALVGAVQRSFGGAGMDMSDMAAATAEFM